MIIEQITTLLFQIYDNLQYTSDISITDLQRVLKLLEEVQALTKPEGE